MSNIPPPPDLEASMDYLRAQIEAMPEEARQKILSEMTDQQRQILLPGGKASLGKDGLRTEEKGIMISPTPGFTLKTRNMVNNQKIFVNICSHTNIDEPGLKKKLNDKGEEIEGYNVPMSIGPSRNCKDKAGVDSIVFDIIVNPKVTEDVKLDETHKQRDFICQLSIQCLENKYKLECDKRYKLPNVEYIGEITEQYVRDRKNAPKIEEVGSKPVSNSAQQAAAAAAAKKLQPKAVVYENNRELNLKCLFSRNKTISLVESEDTVIKDEMYRPSNTFVEPIQTPPVDVTAYVFVIDPLTLMNTDSSDATSGGKTSATEQRIDIQKHIKLTISPFKLQLNIIGYKPISLYFPMAILPSEVKSKLTRVPGSTTMMLRYVLLCPIDKKQVVYLPDMVLSHWDGLTVGDPGSRPWLMSHAMNHEAANNEKKIYEVSPSSGLAASEVVDHTVNPFVVYSQPNGAIPAPSAGSFDAPRNSSSKPSIDDELLPEDRFHGKDAGSQYIINQREQGIADKRDKHEKEKSMRMNDPNVEYVDTDDFKTGGKYAPEKELTEAEVELRKGASNIQHNFQGAGSGVVETAPVASSIHDLNSKMWSELL